jgi:hypothetical protein
MQNSFFWGATVSLYYSHVQPEVANVCAKIISGFTSYSYCAKIIDQHYRFYQLLLFRYYLSAFQPTQFLREQNKKELFNFFHWLRSKYVYYTHAKQDFQKYLFEVL